MNDEEYQSPIDFNSFVSDRLSSKQLEPNPKTSFDPYKLMADRKKAQDGEFTYQPVQKWPEEDIKKLEDFCKQYGILGFNCGRMPPLVALSMLKQKLGIIDSIVDNKYNINNPYGSTTNNKKILLKG